MKDATDIGTIVKNKVYTVPTFSSFYGKKINGGNTTVKFYNKTNSTPNEGVMPITLVKVLMNYMYDKTELTTDELDAVAHLELAFAALNK